MLRVGVIGLGPIGTLHARLYQEDPLADLVAVCDLRHDRAERAAKTYGVRAFTELREMLSAMELDVCSVATGGYEYGS